MEFGSAPVLIRSTNIPGKIKVVARPLFEGAHAPAAAEIEIESVAPVTRMNYLEEEDDYYPRTSSQDREGVRQQMSEEQIKKALDEVEQQQTDFGEKHQKK